MNQLDNLKANTVSEQVTENIGEQATLTTDGSNSYNALPVDQTEHNAVVIEVKEQAGKALPWAHITISNAKRLLLDVHHSIGKEYIQSYLDEFCYKFNRRYHVPIFDRLVVASFSLSVAILCKQSDILIILSVLFGN